MRFNKKLSRKQLTISVVLLLIFLGIAIPIVGRAATTAVISFEAESGTLSGCAATSSDGTASGSAAVEFGTCPLSPSNLDPSGATVPDSDYLIPSGAIYLSTSGSDSNSGTSISSPVATLNQAEALVPSGGTIVVRGGTYRQWLSNSANTSYNNVTKPFTLQAYPHEQVWFDGADIQPTSNWASDGAGHYDEPLNTPSFCNGEYYTLAYNAQDSSSSNSGPCTHYDQYGNTEATYPAAGDPQMIFVDGTQYREVDTLAGVTSGTFFYDWSAKKVYLGINPSGHTVEAATRPVALVSSATGAKILGIGFKDYASNEYPNTTEGGVYLAGNDDLVENDVFTQMAGGGLYLQPTGGVIRHVIMAFNGYNGLGSNGHQHSSGATDGLIIEDSLINANNQEHYGLVCSVSCAAAGIKIAHMDGFVLQDNIIENNVAPADGFWCDLACSNGVMVNNYIANNGGAGISYEVSNTGIIASNIIMNNNSYGLRLPSANTSVYNNTFINNTSYGEVWVYDDSRSYGYSGWTDVGPDTANDSIVNNVFYDTTDVNTILRAQGQSTTQTNTVPSQFFSAIDYNAYFRSAGAGQNLMRWIPPTAEVDYKSTSAMNTALGFDKHSIDITTGSDPFFTNFSGGDYTISLASSAYHTGTSIPSAVATAAGLSTASGQNVGALVYPTP